MSVHHTHQSFNLYPLNQEVFRNLYDVYWERLYGIAYNRLRHTGEAEDVVQQVFVNLWKNKDQLHEVRSIDAYLACAVRYMVYNIIRHRAVKAQYFQKQEHPLHIFDHSTEHQLSFNELYRTMESIVDGLPPKCKLVFTMSRIEGYSNQEIADKTGLSVRTVEHHINKALKILRGGMGDLLFIEAVTFFLSHH